MNRKDPLGSAEQEVLRVLTLRGGRWQVGERPLWENRHWTVQILRGLTIKGYVDEVTPDESYKMAQGRRRG